MRERFAETCEYNPSLPAYMEWVDAQDRLHVYESENAELAIETLEPGA